MTEVSQVTELPEVKKQRQNPTRLVSYDVFMHHVKFSDAAGEDGIDVSGIFDKPCFDEWIETRKRLPKNPAESFRKALVAHVAGKDDRKPFPAKVEAKILERLRVSAPWPCFKGGTDGSERIGERGLKRSSLGFHEEKSKKARTPKNSATNAQGIDLLPDMLGGFQAVPMMPTFPTFLPTGVDPQGQIQTEPYVSDSENFVNNFTHLIVFKSIQYDQIKAQQNSFGQNFPLPHSTVLCKFLSTFYSVTQIRELANTCFQFQRPLIDHEIAYKLDNSSFEVMPYTQQWFLSPVAELNGNFVGFEDNKQIGCYVVNAAGIISSSDEKANDILSMNLVGQFEGLLFLDPVQRALSLRYLLERIANNQEGWCRKVFVDQKAQKRKIVLAKCIMLRGGDFQCEIQDCTAQFPELNVPEMPYI
eukprot:maker-scaffold_26-snap-gene-2.56-mRNA-1 protein AED:0.00 eAED:0.00 QI:100/1/1/1/1/1/4/299/416